MKRHLLRLGASLSAFSVLTACMTAGRLTCVYDAATGKYHCGGEVGTPPAPPPGQV